ncbi:fimbria/pilus periplasmic chaperone [Scandinavium sp. NPDC088450]|uniref:fimbria/pilus periplasmic chaperone n=1 Tax=Scandinavium sp. NPDC088450 TaxID=3364514 RepID=UPI00384B467F
MKFPDAMTHLLRALTLACLLSTAAHASIVITGTRVIYPSDAKEVSVRVSNKGKAPVLLQSWLDDGDTKATPDKIKVPFVLTPPINRVEGGSGQTLRIRSTPNTLPSDRESVFWLNVLEIPAVPNLDKQESKNFLQVAFRSRIKFFWRPAGLKGNAGDGAKALTWHAAGNTLRVKNPSPYYVSLSTVSVGGKKADGKMIAPFSDDTYSLNASPGSKVTAEYISDYGALIKTESVAK